MLEHPSSRSVRLLALIACGTLSCVAPGGGRPSTFSGPQPQSSYPPRDLQTVRPQTRAERSGFTETSTYADVVAFIDSLKSSPQ
ncbi:MAG: hypothetical protein ACRENU_00120, partial [Gemmatimonadaceae bacterium]